MSDDIEKHNAADYEERYRSGYGLLYPESHLIRVHRHILEWELGLKPGKALDFGCGAGANISYFRDQGYEPYGCDTSETAIARAQKSMPEHAENFFVSQVNPDLESRFEPESFTLFLSNQVLYFLTDDAIREVVRQAHRLVRPGGVFIASMMARSCWYHDHVSQQDGDFGRVDMNTPRQKMSSSINFKDREELPALFEPFERLHIGSYGSWIREDEGATDHWLYVGVRR